MTLATAIVIIETLATFSPPPVAIVPDKMSGFYIACPNGIYHYEDDTLAQNTSRADNEMLSGITDIAFSGQWLYVAVPMKNTIYQYDRFLRLRGKIDTGMFYPQQIAVYSDGSICAFDEMRQKIIEYSSVGDPVEDFKIISKSSLKNPVLIGIANWKDFIHCIADENDSNSNLSQQIVSVETPIVWSSSSKYIAAGVERDVSFGISNDIENIYLSDRDIAYFLSSGEMVICGQPPIEWTLPTPSQIVIEKIAKKYTIYCIIEDKIVEVVVKWE